MGEPSKLHRSCLELAERHVDIAAGIVDSVPVGASLTNRGPNGFGTGGPQETIVLCVACVTLTTAAAVAHPWMHCVARLSFNAVVARALHLRVRHRAPRGQQRGKHLIATKHMFHAPPVFGLDVFVRQT